MRWGRKGGAVQGEAKEGDLPEHLVGVGWFFLLTRGDGEGVSAELGTAGASLSLAVWLLRSSVLDPLCYSPTSPPSGYLTYLSSSNLP